MIYPGCKKGMHGFQVYFVTPHAHARAGGYVIGAGVHMFADKNKFESYFSDRLTFSNIHSRTSRRIHRLALPLRRLQTRQQTESLQTGKE